MYSMSEDETARVAAYMYSMSEDETVRVAAM
jgi:hypothetical protein